MWMQTSNPVTESVIRDYQEVSNAFKRIQRFTVAWVGLGKCNWNRNTLHLMSDNPLYEIWPHMSIGATHFWEGNGNNFPGPYYYNETLGKTDNRLNRVTKVTMYVSVV